MTKGTNRWMFGAGCLVAGALVGALAIGAGPDSEKSPGMPFDDAAMQRCMEFGTPGKHHAHLAKYTGDWDLTVKSWMEPGATPETQPAKSTAKTIMDGRYLVEKVTGQWDMGGEMMPFEGMAICGYDNHKQQFFSMWIDNFSTGVLEEWGEMQDDGKTLKTKGQMYNPWVGSMVDVKSITKIVDANTRTMEMWMPASDGKMFKHMEITYKRK